jgi:hypothetical protein
VDIVIDVGPNLLALAKSLTWLSALYVVSWVIVVWCRRR